MLYYIYIYITMLYATLRRTLPWYDLRGWLGVQSQLYIISIYAGLLWAAVLWRCQNIIYCMCVYCILYCTILYTVEARFFSTKIWRQQHFREGSVSHGDQVLVSVSLSVSVSTTPNVQRLDHVSVCWCCRVWGVGKVGSDWWQWMACRLALK